MTPQEKAIGDANFKRAVGQMKDAQVPVANPQGGVTRRQFMQGLVAAGATVPIAAAAYFGYTNNNFRERPVRAAVIGVGDEGGVLIGEHNPQYLEVVAICDIRPSNYMDRIWKGESPPSPRKGLNHHYGNAAKSRIKHYTDFRQMIQDKTLGLEAVVIALPLHLHAPVAMACMDAGLHVLCEKLMAWDINQCKQMIRKAKDKGVVLSIGHQRHYSMLYAHANEMVSSGLLGEIHHIRALWHRNNARPRPQPNPNDPGDRFIDSWRKSIAPEDLAELGNDLARYGYQPSSTHTALEELVRWRLYDQTGGGLMAELGSHQLDACSIFLGKVHPLAVTAVGGKYFYTDDRETEDHVFCTFEFPGKNYHPNGNANERKDIVVVTYSSINTNSFEPYGECVMGTKGTLVVEEEQKAMLWPAQGIAPNGPRGTSLTVSGSTPTITSASEVGGPAAQAQAVGQNALGHGPPSRGYREEMEHFAYVIRMREQAGSEAERDALKVRCDGEAAMADAIVALVANKAMRTHQRIEFAADWYNYQSNAVPDDPNHPPRTLPS
jgi:predicted dehydrogenase